MRYLTKSTRHDESLSKREQLEVTKKKFVRLASEISNCFPEIDLRFNLTVGTNSVRCFLPEYLSSPLELPLELVESQDLIYEAVFQIKEIIGHFDA